MILRSELVLQVIDGDERATFVKEVVMTPGDAPLGMVRKRLADAHGAPCPTRAPVLLIHGFGQNRYTWHASRRSFSSYLARAGFDVFNMDLRGHGRSRRFGAPRPRALDEYVQKDAPACIDEALRLSGAPQLFLIGHSMGGLISYAAASTLRRAQVRGIVSLGSPYRFGRGSATLAAFRTFVESLRLTGVLDANVPLPLRLIGGHLRKRAALWDTHLVPMPVRAWMPQSIERDLLDEYLAKAFDRTSLRVALDILKAGQQAAFKSMDGMVDYGAAFEHFDVPLLVIAGSHDMLAPPSSVRPAFASSRSTDKTYRELPLGHIDLVIGREATTTVWPTVREWLERRSSGP